MRNLIAMVAVLGWVAGCSSSTGSGSPGDDGGAGEEGSVGGGGSDAGGMQPGVDASGGSSDGGDAGSGPTEAGTNDAPSYPADAGDGGTTSSNAPPAAAAVGYTVNTFSSHMDKGTIDLGNTQKSGFQWYLGQFFGSAATDPGNLAFNSDGSLTLDGKGTSSNAGINTASPSSGGWVGVAFGGGAYFEATFKFNPQDTINTGGNGWPSWWAMAIEHLAGLPSEQWPGQPSGYDHFIETDFFEYDVWSFSPQNEYGGATHDWYGVYAQTCGGGNYCNVSNSGGGGTNFSNFQVQTPAGTDYTQYHSFGYLWIPATASTQGSATYYFDGQATNDSITWSQYTGNEQPPPGTAPWTFGVLDQQHVALILGTGANEPMTIQSVNVWQKSASQNLVQ